MLRRKVLAERSSFSAEAARKLSGRITHQLRGVAALQKSHLFMAYANIRSEVDTTELICYLLSEDKQVALPVLDINTLEINARLLGQDYPFNLACGPFGIPEPLTGEFVKLERLDCIFLPGVVFDRKGYRVGFGKGCYDRLLARVSENTLLIGLAFDFQVYTTVYPEEHDRKVHMIATESGIKHCR